MVNLSSIGADLESGAGPISGLHDVEELLNDAVHDITHLRPVSSYENLLWQLDTLRKWGRISLPLSGTTRYPMIAIGDIGRAAAQRLANPSWTGRNICELHGAAELCFDEVAKILTEVLGRKIVYIKCDPQEMRQYLLENGMSENAADSLLEMYAAVEAGKLKTLQPRSAKTTTPTTLAEFARETLLSTNGRVRHLITSNRLLRRPRSKIRTMRKLGLRMVLRWRSPHIPHLHDSIHINDSVHSISWQSNSKTRLFYFLNPPFLHNGVARGGLLTVSLRLD